MSPMITYQPQDSYLWQSICPVVQILLGHFSKIYLRSAHSESKTLRPGVATYHAQGISELNTFRNNVPRSLVLALLTENAARKNNLFHSQLLH